MLEKYFETLEKEKQIAVERVKKGTDDAELIQVALKEIDINEATLKNYLKQMDSEGYKLNEDLTDIEEDYFSCEHYRFLSNHVSHHLRSIRRVPEEVEAGEFFSRLQPNVNIRFRIPKSIL
jgi:predicted nuclease with TOPRIM domain